LAYESLAARDDRPSGCSGAVVCNAGGDLRCKVLVFRQEKTLTER
jgi:hypothetical protein